MKKHTRKSQPQSSPAPAAPFEGGEATDAPAAARPSWRQTFILLAGGWAALLVCALLWRFWTGRPLVVYLAAGMIALCYTLIVLIDRFRTE